MTNEVLNFLPDLLEDFIREHAPDFLHTFCSLVLTDFHTIPNQPQYKSDSDYCISNAFINIHPKEWIIGVFRWPTDHAILPILGELHDQWELSIAVLPLDKPNQW